MKLDRVMAVAPDSHTPRAKSSNAGRIPVSRNFVTAGLAWLWRRFLRANFSGPKEVRAFFDVSTTTAYAWWSGDAAPGALHIIKVYESEHADAWREVLREEE